MIGIDLSNVGFAVIRGRAETGATAARDPAFSLDAVRMAELVEALAVAATCDGLGSFVHCVGAEDQIRLMALVWIGRGTYVADEWDQALTEARFAHDARSARYLVDLPSLSEDLKEGLRTLLLAERKSREKAGLEPAIRLGLAGSSRQ
ncbi:MAG TPA: DUF3775 domain-containing protein [Rhizomicrobium sp.]|jgi:hypothetical protein|nr:DUF3775 domain-containing protein [Rhizomicrobium sp.]